MDEAGRGAWAGPLVVAAVELNRIVPGVMDSKKLGRQRREHLAEAIKMSANFVGVGVVESAEIDKIGLSSAHYLAYSRALENRTDQKSKNIIIDGNINYLKHCPKAVCVIKADQSVPEVSAASIIAKVYRDDLMTKLASLYPVYGFGTNVGYGTNPHHKALMKFGITPHHRLSFKPVNDILLSCYPQIK